VLAALLPAVDRLACLPLHRLLTLLPGVEFYSDAKDIHTDVDGLVWVEACLATEGGT
jgi:hypothetical protein